MRRARWDVGAVVLVALAAVAGAVLFVLRSSFRGVESESAGFGSSPSAVGASGEDGEADGIALESAPVAQDGPEAKTTPRELPDGIWIRGRVVVPPGTPPDEHVEIAARVLSLDDGPGYAAAMGEDGSFAVMFPKDADSGWIEMHARYLLLGEDEAVDLEEPPQEVLLEPILGGRVRGRIVAAGRSAGESRALAGTIVELSASTTPDTPRFPSRRRIVGQDLRFEFPALPPISGFELAMQAKDFLPFLEKLAIAPGTTTEVEVALHSGVCVSGRVLDPDGNPVAGAVAWKTENPPQEFPDRSQADAVTGPDGSFVMTAIPSGEVSISFRSRGCLREIVELGRLDDGDSRRELEVRLRTGFVNGRVEWPDGSPAVGALVELVPGPQVLKADRSMWSLRRSTLGDGSFAIETVVEGPFSLSARSPAGVGGASRDASPVGVAIVEEVRPSGVPIVLVLGSGETVRGRVTDDLGAPVTSFTVRGQRNQEMASLTGSLSSIFRHPDGEFAFTGLPGGRWVFRASVGQLKSSRPAIVQLPDQGVPIVLVIPRSTTVSGTVLDPDGHPIAGADVRSPNHLTFSGEDGGFSLQELPSGRLEIWAEAEAYAPSELALVRVESGASVTEVRLVLRRGGTIRCQVLDAESRPEPRRRIALFRADAAEVYQKLGASDQSSNADGELEFKNLAPGHYWLSKQMTSQESLGRMDSGPNLRTRFAASRTKASVDVIEGEITRVVIGGPKGPPIHLLGKVTDGGAPVSGIEVATWARELEEEEPQTTDAEGRFELLVPEPGELALSLAFVDRDLLLTTRTRIVGSSPETLRLVLPQGRISGVVRSGDGRPLDDAEVTILSEETSASSSSWTATGSTRSADGGRFFFENFPGGHFVLSARNGSPSEGVEGTTSELTLEEGADLHDLVIRLP
jgi:protocatechuate 3,4-dioxygenase beta subunit